MARDSRKFGRDARDRSRYQRNQRGASHPMVGGTQREATVRESLDSARDRQGASTKTVTREDRYDLRVPSGLGDRVKGIHVKQDVVRTYDTATDALLTERSMTPKLVIVFREHQQGIHGMPVPRAVANKQRKASFTHAVIQRIPPEAMEQTAGPRLPIDICEERGFRLTCYAPKGGHKQHGQHGGEVVHDVTDELSVLQFLFEHDLLALYTIPHLVSSGFLPKRDEERVREDSITAQFALAFDCLVPEYTPRSYHWARLRHRLLIVYGGETTSADAAFAATVRGKQFSYDDVGMAAMHAEAFYYSEGLSLAYGVYFFPNFRAVVSYDIAKRTIIGIEPIPCDRTDAEQLDRYNAAFLANPNYRRVSWYEFARWCAGSAALSQHRDTLPSSSPS